MAELVVYRRFMSEKIIRDPVHDVIAFRLERPVDQLLFRLLNAAEFQRLRRIRQLGMASLAYPGADHSRYSHSVGVMETARKIIAQLRQWFPASLLVGWKFEVDGDTQSVIELARRQLDECHTDACVANGPAYGAGFGLVSAAGPNHFVDREAFFTALERILNTRAKAW